MGNAAIVKALVKGLEWETIGARKNFSRAKAPLFGNIRVENYGDTFTVAWSVPGFSDTFTDGDFPTLAAAQAAAEQDYRARIAAALHIDKIAALVEAGVAAEVQLRECGVKMVGPGASALADLRDALAAFRGTEDGAAP